MKADLLRIWWKALWNNRKSYFSVFLCGILLLSIVFFTTALGDCMTLITSDHSADMVSEYSTLTTFLPTYWLLLFLLGSNILRYMRVRLPDYEMFQILGIKKKHKYMFVALEYVGISIISIFGGLLVGFLEAEILRVVLRYLFKDIVPTVSYGSSPIKRTLYIGFMMFSIMYVVLDILVSSLGIKEVLGIKKKNGSKIPFDKKILWIGIVLFALAVLSLGFYWGKVWRVYPLMMAILAMIILMRQVVGFLLNRQKTKEKKYYRRLLWLNSWYHQFKYHVNMVVIISAFIFVTLSYFLMALIDNTPLTENENYPYDLVWLANQDDEEFLNTLEGKYGVEIETHPCMRVTGPDFGEHTGISESEFEKWTGKQLELSDKEIYVIYQRERSERDRLGLDYDNGRPRLYIGSARYDLWQYIIGPTPGREFRNRYKKVGDEDFVLTGVFKDGVSEHIIVFSDEFYEEVSKNADGADLVVMMQISQAYEEVANEVTVYAKEHSEIDFFAGNGENLIYEREEELLESREKKLMISVSAGINMMLLFLCGIFVFVIKMRNDEEDILEKDTFYFLAGMEKRKRRNCIRKEVTISVVIAFVWGIEMALIFCLVQIFLKSLAAGWVTYYSMLIGISIICIVAVFLMVAFWKTRRIYRKGK